MKRIDTPTAIPNKNGPGKAGFQDGNLATGAVSTDLDETFFNMFQEELCNLVEGAGIVLNAESKTQLLAAVNALILAKFTGSNQSLSTYPFQKLPGGVILEWGEASLPASNSYTSQVSVVYPTAFPVALAGPFAMPYESVNSGTGYTPIMRTLARTTAGFTMVGDTNNTVLFDKACKFGWFSIGY